MPHSLHHIHQRKRVHEKHEPFPNPRPGIRFLDRLLVVLAVAGPLVSIPQIVTLYQTRATNGFSLITWVFLSVLNIPWIIYGFVHRDRPIMITSTLWFISNILMVIGIILFS